MHACMHACIAVVTHIILCDIDEYKCHIAAFGSFPASYTSTTLTCSVTVSALTVATPSDRQAAAVSVSYGSTMLDIDFNSSDEVDLYDCNRLTDAGCAACGPPCGWCVLDNACEHASSECLAGSAFVSLALQCPAVQALDVPSVHVGDASDVVMTVEGVNLPNPSLGTAAYTCSFSPSTALAAATATGTFVNSTHVRCTLPLDSGAAVGSTGILERSIALSLNARVIPEAVSASMSFKSYDCPTMGGGGDAQCTRCLVPQHLPYDCGWCPTSVDGCVQRATCEPVTEWIENQPDAINSCPNPEIEDITPVIIPTTGGTRITISGSNLGRTLDDVARVLIGATPCVKDSIDPSKNELVCVAGVASSEGVATASVTLTSGASASMSAAVRVVRPVVSSLTPTTFIASGGAVASLRGVGLDAGTDVVITVDGVGCSVRSQVATLITCVMSARPARRRRNASPKVCVAFDGAGCSVTEVADSAVSIVEDPIISRITPGVSPASGGIVLTIAGQRITEPQVAVMTLFRNASGGGQRVATCDLTVAGDALVCSSLPALGTAATDDGMGSWLRFDLDDLVLTQSGPIFHHDPEIYSISPESALPGELIVISGRYLTRSGQVRVLIGDVEAEIVSAQDDQLTVRVPETPEGSADVSITHGASSSKLAAPLTVKAEPASADVTPLAAGIGGGAAFVIILIFVVYRIKLHKRAAAERMLVKQMADLESQVIDVAKQGFAELQAGGTLALGSEAVQPRSYGTCALLCCLF